MIGAHHTALLPPLQKAAQSCVPAVLVSFPTLHHGVWRKSQCLLRINFGDFWGRNCPLQPKYTKQQIQAGLRRGAQHSKKLSKRDLIILDPLQPENLPRYPGIPDIKVLHGKGWFLDPRHQIFVVFLPYLQPK